MASPVLCGKVARLAVPLSIVALLFPSGVGQLGFRENPDTVGQFIEKNVCCPCGLSRIFYTPTRRHLR
jgi:hypothetical protein